MQHCCSPYPLLLHTSSSSFHQQSSLKLMKDQGLAPLSDIYRTFGAVPRTLIIFNEKSCQENVVFLAK